jgi:hypothetical protein
MRLTCGRVADGSRLGYDTVSTDWFVTALLSPSSELHAIYLKVTHNNLLPKN